MCLPFLCRDRDREDHGSGANHDARQQWPATPPPRPPPPTSDHGDGGYPYEPSVASSSTPLRGANHGYGVGNNFGAGDVNGGPGTAAVYNSDSDMPASVGFVRGRIAAPQTPQRKEPRTVAPTPTWGAPEKREPTMVVNTHVAAGARHHGPDAASQPKERATDTMQTAPVPQVARRDEDDEAATAAASSYTRWM